MDTEDGRHKARRKFTLDDGVVITVEELVDRTGLPKSTCYARLSRWTNPEKVFGAVSPTQSGRVYTLDDGSVWTALTLAQHLQCKKSTAGTRLSMMNGESKRILSPVRGGSYYDEQAGKTEEVKKRVRDRMLYDLNGHWALLNKNT